VSCEPRGARLSLRPCGVAVGRIQFQTHGALSYVDDVHARCILYSQSDENIFGCVELSRDVVTSHH